MNQDIRPTSDLTNYKDLLKDVSSDHPIILKDDDNNKKYVLIQVEDEQKFMNGIKMYKKFERKF